MGRHNPSMDLSSRQAPVAQASVRDEGPIELGVEVEKLTPMEESSAVHEEKKDNADENLDAGPPADALNVDLRRPQGTWSRSIICDPEERPVWAFLTGGGGKKKRAPDGGPTIPTISRRCAGVWTCTAEGCDNVARPSTSAGKNKNDETPACNRCRHMMSLVECYARWNIATRVDGTKVAYHEGVHLHAPPPERSLPPDVRQAASALILANPNLTPAELQAGRNTFDPEHPLFRPSLSSIHPKLSSASAAHHMRKAAFAEAGIGTPATAATRRTVGTVFDFLADLQAKVKDTISYQSVETATVIHIQTLPMRQWLNCEEGAQMVKEEIARSGLATDAHNTFFGKGWTLIQTVTFSDAMSRWVPVLYTVASAETKAVYEAHFSRILESFTNQHDLDTISRRFLHVADFSQAQQTGFYEAYGSYYATVRATSVSDRAALKEEGILRAQGLYRGCSFHLTQTIQRIVKSKRVPDGGDVASSRALYNFFFAKSPSELITKKQAILDKWPGLKTWLEWWTQPRVMAMAGPVMVMTAADRAKGPATSNAAESAHSLLLRGAGSEKYTLEAGLPRLLDAAFEFARKDQAACEYTVTI